MSHSIALLRERTRARLADVADRFGVELPPVSPKSLGGEQDPLLSAHQKWVFHERLDLHADFDLSAPRDQARLLHWWVHHMRAEYGAPDETLAWGHLSSPYAPSSEPFASLHTVLMQKSYLLSDDLQADFDLSTTDGRAAFIEWFFRHGLFKDELDETPYVHHILPELVSPATADESELPVNKFAALVLQRFGSEFKPSARKSAAAVDAAMNGVLNRVAPELLYLYRMFPDGAWPVNPRLAVKGPAAVVAADSRTGDDAAEEELTGANLIGYAHGAFGMGEHVKMAARALSVWSDKFSIVDVSAYAHDRQPEPDILEWSQRSARYPVNIFHVNADAIAGALNSIGPSIATDRYNVGYWAWELSKVPDCWRPSIDFVDEIWAPSVFIQEAFQEVTDKPVIHMPLCVDLSFDAWKRRKHFGLPDDKFLFLYYFDSHSYYQRKNPYAALRAFKQAFPDRNDVGLVIKTQNAKASSSEWLQLLELAEGDPRIHILNKTMSKGEVMSLQVECDCFISLHRSEGFGRGPAEAMWLGKPVIVTGYSGNMDFTLPDNSLLVDFELVRVRPMEYPFHQGQVWAQPDEEHAAKQMRRLVDEPGLAEDLARRGMALMRDSFSFKAIGKRYADRLKEIHAL